MTNHGFCCHCNLHVIHSRQPQKLWQLPSSAVDARQSRWSESVALFGRPWDHWWYRKRLSPLGDLMFKAFGLADFAHLHIFKFSDFHHLEDAMNKCRKWLQLPNPEHGQTISPIIPQRSEIIRLPPALDASCHPTCSSFFHHKNHGEFANLWQKLWAQTSARAPRPQATLHCLGEQPEPCRKKWSIQNWNNPGTSQWMYLLCGCFHSKSSQNLQFRFLPTQF